MRFWRRKQRPFDHLLRETVRAMEKSGHRLPADRNEALTAVSQVIADLVKLVGDFEGTPYSRVPTRSDWFDLGRTAVRIVDRRRR